MSVIWLDEAIDDLKALRHYIARENVLESVRMVKKILSAIESLSNHPGMGRQGRVLNTREFIIVGTPYIVPYRF